MTTKQGVLSAVNIPRILLCLAERALAQLWNLIRVIPTEGCLFKFKRYAWFNRLWFRPIYLGRFFVCQNLWGCPPKRMINFEYSKNKLYKKANRKRCYACADPYFKLFKAFRPAIWRQYNTLQYAPPHFNSLSPRFIMGSWYGSCKRNYAAFNGY